MRIGIVDSGISNLGSVFRWVNHAGLEPTIIVSPTDVKNIDLIIFPGVGSFDRCTNNLRKRELTEVIVEHINKGKKYLGICLGFQLLYSTSTEGVSSGMGIFKSKIERLDINEKISLPHVGFNDVTCIGTSEFSQFDQSTFYFTHSYGLVNNVDQYAGMYGLTEHDHVKVISMIHHENVLGCQFHPEKSSSVGIDFLQKVLAWSKKD